MEPESSNNFCSLCRRPMTPAPTNLSLAARLCDQCKAMIDAVRPGQSKTAAPGIEAGVISTTQRHSSAPEVTNPQFGEPAVPSNGPERAVRDRIKTPASPLNHNKPGPASLDEWAPSGTGFAEVAEWPVVVEPEKKKSSARLLLLLLAAVLVAAAGAAVYMNLDLLKSWVGVQSSSNSTSNNSVITQNDFRPQQSQSASALQTGQQTATPAPAQSQTLAASAVSPSGQSGQTTPAPGQKLVSLQVASFPSEAAARGFAEKLIRSGVPAYIVAAEIPRRGRWFRVRAGKFASADEAKKYVNEWSQRARTVGLGIQLVVCDYEEP